MGIDTRNASHILLCFTNVQTEVKWTLLGKKRQCKLSSSGHECAFYFAFLGKFHEVLFPGNLICAGLWQG